MLTYDLYKNRIKRLVAIKQLIVKFRLWIIIALSLLAAALAAFLATKGMITANVVVLTSEIHYGDEYQLQEAKSLFSSTSLEYSAVGDEDWTTNKPTHAGKYAVRAVAKGSFGKRYGTAVEFEILPKATTFAVRDESVVYGDSPKQIEFPLLAGDVLVTDGLRYDYADYAAAETDVTVQTDSIRIVDAKGADVTDCYAVTPIAHTVMVTPRAITVRPRPVITEFNGSAVAYTIDVDDATRAALQDDEITFSIVITDQDGNVVDKPIYAGTYTITIIMETQNRPLASGRNGRAVTHEGGFAITKNDVDVTHQYNVTLATSTLTITKKAVTVTTASQSHVYDGTPCSAKKIAEHDPLGNGHELHFAGDTRVEITDVGSISNVYSANDFVVYDTVNNLDITPNYILSVKAGTLTVTPRPIVITTPDDSHIYDGTPFTSDKLCVSDWLYDEHHIVVTAPQTVTNVWETSTGNNTTRCAVWDSDNKDVSRNYDISYACGTLTVEQRPVTVTRDNVSKVYDGSPLLGDQAHGDRFVLGHKAVAIGTVTQITLVAESGTANTTDFTVGDANGNLTVGDHAWAENYTVTVAGGGILTVTPRSLSVLTASDSKIYDGTPLSAEEPDSVSGLVAGHRLVPAVNTITRVTDYTPTPIENRTQYTIADGNGNDVTDNYAEIDYNYGTLRIDKRAITVHTASADKVYDGTPLEKYDGYFADNLVAGHTLRHITDVRVAITDYGTRTNEYTFTVQNGDTDVTANYQIGYDYGTLTVTQKEITVTTEGATQVYNGNELTQRTEFAAVGLVEIDGKEIHEIRLDSSREGEFATITDVGTTPNRLYFTVYNKDNYAVCDNYTINYDRSMFGNLVVTPRPIVVTTPDGSKEYDGQPLSSTDGATPSWLNSVHKLVADRVKEITDVDETAANNNTTTYKVYTKDTNQDVTFNYTITYICGKLTVTPRNLVIRIRTLYVPYTGEPQYDDVPFDIWHTNESGTYFYGDEGLIGNDTYRSTSAKIYVTNVWDSLTDGANIYDYIIVDERGVESGNYTIVKVEGGNLIVTPRPVTVTRNDLEKVYDGEPLRGDQPQYLTNGITELATGDNFVLGHKAVLKPSGTVSAITDVWDSGANDTEFTVADKSDNLTLDGHSLSENYDLTVVGGTLTVTPHPITITTPSYEKVYDGKPLWGHNEDTESGNGFSADWLYKDHYTTVSGRVVEIMHVRESGTLNRTMCAIASKTGSSGFVTENYDISYNYGTLTITKRPLSVTLLDLSKEYDGTPLTGDTCKIECDGLVEQEWWLGGDYKPENIVSIGQKIIPVNSSAVSKITNTWEISIQNNTQFTVSYENGNTYMLDINGEIIDDFKLKGYTLADDYEIIFNRGTLTVTPRLLTITRTDKTKVYDGTPLLGNEATGDNFVLDHKAVAVGTVTRITNVWESGIANDTAFTVADGKGNLILDGHNLAENYAVTVTGGTLTVQKRKIRVIPQSREKVYDGEPLQGYSAIAEWDGSGEALVVRHSLQSTGTVTSITNVWESGTVIETKFIIWGPNDSERYDDAHLWADNYDTQMQYGATLTVTKRDLTVRTESKDFVYADIDFDHHAFDFKGAIDGHKVLMKDWATVHDVMYDGDTVVGRNNTATASVALDSILDGLPIIDSITDADGVEHPLIDNYNVTYIFGTLTVTRRPIQVTTLDREKYYDGKPLTREDYLVNNLVESHALYDPNYTSITDVGTKENATTYAIKRNADDVDVTRNYNISYTYGTLEVLPCELTVCILDWEKMYNGVNEPYAEHFADGAFYEITSGALAEHETLDIEVFYQNAHGDPAEPIAAGNYTVHSEQSHCTVTGGREKIGNYAITFQSGKLTVNRRKVVLGSKEDVIVEYSGEGVDYTAFDYRSWLLGDDESADNGVLEADRNQVKPMYRYTDPLDSQLYRDTPPKNVGIYFVQIFDVEKSDITDNYEFTYADSVKLTIEKRAITVRPIDGNDHKTYDNTALTYADLQKTSLAYTVISGSVVTGEPLNLRATFDGAESIIDAGDYTVQFDEEYLTLHNPNYAITVETGNYRIDKRTLHVQTDDWNTTYDGNPHTTPDGRIGQLTDPVDTADITSWGHKLALVGELFQVTNAGTHENKQVLQVVDAAGNSVDGNYNIQYTYGTIVIAPKTITVTVAIADPTKIYDAAQFTIQEGDRSVAGLVGGHILQVKTWSPMIEVDTYTDYEIVDYDITDAAGNTSVEEHEKTYALKDNYTIAYGTRTAIRITPYILHLRASVRSFTYEYNGQDRKTDILSALDVETCFTESYTPDAFTVDTCSVVGNDNADKAVLHAGSYTVTVQVADMMFDGKKWNKNYQIEGGSTLQFSVTVKPYSWLNRNILIKTPDAEKPYDGTPLSDTRLNQPIPKDDSFPLNHTIVATNCPSITAPGELENKLVFKVVNGVGVDVTARDFEQFPYDSDQYTVGKLKVSPTLSLALDDIEYDGAGHYGKGLSVDSFTIGYTSDGNSSSHTLLYTATVAGVYMSTDAGYVEVDAVCNVGTYRVYLQNPTLTHNDGSQIPADIALVIRNASDTPNTYFCDVTVLPRDITVKPNKRLSVKCNGIASLRYTADEITGDRLVEGHKLVLQKVLVKVSGSNQRFVSATTTMLAYDIIDSQTGASVKANYKITEGTQSFQKLISTVPIITGAYEWDC